MSASKKVTIEGLRCVKCALKRITAFENKRAIFFHLLYHRDAGHAVSKEMLDEYDPDMEPPDAKEDRPGKEGTWVQPEVQGLPKGRVVGL